MGDFGGGVIVAVFGVLVLLGIFAALAGAGRDSAARRGRDGGLSGTGSAEGSTGWWASGESGHHGHHGHHGHSCGSGHSGHSCGSGSSCGSSCGSS